MKKASEYRQHAAECRALAIGMTDDQRNQLLEMAATWDRLAEERSELVRRYPELSRPGEQVEELEIAHRRDHPSGLGFAPQTAQAPSR